VQPSFVRAGNNIPILNEYVHWDTLSPRYISFSPVGKERASQRLESLRSSFARFRLRLDLRSNSSRDCVAKDSFPRQNLHGRLLSNQQYI
jgi:hypothetical protein